MPPIELEISRHPALFAALLDAACEETRNGILVLDSHGAVLKTNPRFAAIFALADGPGDTDALDRLTQRLAAPADLMRIRRRLAADPLLRVDTELALSGGAIVEARSAPLCTADRQLLGRLWLFRDLTEQRNAEQRLIEEETRFRGVVEHELAGISIIDQAETLVYANPAFARFYDTVPEAVIGQDIATFIRPEVRTRVLGLLRALFAGEQDAARFTCSITSRTGAVLDVRVHASASRYGGQPAVIAVMLDITELEQARQELEYANIIIEQSPVLLFQADATPNFRRSYISRNIANFGYTIEQARNGAFQFPDCVLPADRPAVMAKVASMLDGTADLFEHDYRVGIADGSVRWIHDRTVPIRDATGRTVAFRGTMIDITERKHAEQALARANRTLRTLSSGNEVLVRATSEQQLLEDMCRVLVEVGGYPLCWIGFAGAADGALPVAAVRQRNAEPAMSHRLATMVRSGSPARAALADGAVAIDRRSPGCDTHSGGEPLSTCQCGASAAFPFLPGSATPGVLVLAADSDDGFDSDEVRLLSELASDLGYGIQALRAHAARDANALRLRETMNAVVEALVSTLEQRDPYTAGHQRRVAALSREIARLMRVPAEEIEGIVLAAAVHDVGKVRVPADILARPGKLRPLEYQLVQTHAEAGYDILKGIDFPWPVARMVLQHHERLDGSGYPNGLHGAEILQGARILAVADVVESMMTHRPYRAALGQAAALAEIIDGKGRLYDGNVVDACVALFEEHGFELPMAE